MNEWKQAGTKPINKQLYDCAIEAMLFDTKIWPERTVACIDPEAV